MKWSVLLDFGQGFICSNFTPDLESEPYEYIRDYAYMFDDTITTFKFLYLKVIHS